MLESIGSGTTQMITWLGNVVDAIVSTDGALADLLPVFTLAIAGTVVMFGVKILRSFTWGA